MKQNQKLQTSYKSAGLPFSISQHLRVASLEEEKMKSPVLTSLLMRPAHKTSGMCVKQKFDGANILHGKLLLFLLNQNFNIETISAS